MMKPICLIAARKNSKGVPNKNIKSFVGKPLISYAITSSLQSKIFQSVVVSTENDQIAKISKSYGADIPFKRSKSFETRSGKVSRQSEPSVTGKRPFKVSYRPWQKVLKH